MPLNEEQISAVKTMFYKGYTHREMHYFLERQFDTRIRFSYFSKKILPRLHLLRRGPRAMSPFDDIVETILLELNGPSVCCGSEEMRQILKTKYQLQVPRYVVRELLKIFSPEDTARRRRNRLMRRQYRNHGPNFVWHMDGYDKLSQYGIGIHGAIDGFSRNIIWLKFACTNRDPRHIAGYFMEAVQKQGGCPTVLRSDCGTETVRAAVVQAVLREQHNDSMSRDSVWYGASTANQRIEAWWAQLRRKRSDWWITFFRDMVSNREFQNGNELHRMCLQYAFLNLIQRELDEVVMRWNCHRIRRQRHGDIVSGVPEILYNYPELLGNNCADYLQHVDPMCDEFQVCANDLCLFHDGQDPDFKVVADELCQQNNWNTEPVDAEEAKTLYVNLKTNMEQLI